MKCFNPDDSSRISSGFNEVTAANTALWLVDVQEKLFNHIDNKDIILKHLTRIITICQTLKLPIFVTEQYPEGLGPTICELRSLFDPFIAHKKTTFSGYKTFKNEGDNQSILNWILVGIETHICVLQTAKDLVKNGKNVIVLADCVGSRSTESHLLGLEEMRHYARISQTETITYELLENSNHLAFKTLLPLFKTSESKSNKA